jgi:hypothetical protein
MGDPLSVAGTAVGIVSMGLTVCQGIIDYYSSWKLYNSDIANTYKLVEQLNTTFTLLRDSLESAKPSGSALGLKASEQVETCIVGCEDRIGQLRKKLEKIKGNEPKGGFGRLEAQRLRLLYPFQQGTLGKLRDALLQLADNLEPALQVLNMYVCLSSTLIS